MLILSIILLNNILAPLCITEVEKGKMIEGQANICPQTSSSTMDTQLSKISFISQRVKSAEEMSQQLSLQFQISYFKTIQTAYKTWNYDSEVVKKYCRTQEKIMNGEQKESDSEAVYMPAGLLIGNIFKLEDFRFKGSQCQYQTIKMSFKSTYDNKEKIILIQKSEYKANFIKHFNRMMKNKNEKYLLTHLLPAFYVSKQENFQLYFLLQPQTQLIHLTEQYYNSHFRPLERIIDQDYKFSNIKLSKIYSVDELDKTCKDGFMLAQIKQKFENRERENITIVGIVNFIQQPQYDRNSRNKKEITIWMMQYLYRYDRLNFINSPGFEPIKYQEIGRCKVIVRYSSDEMFVEKLFQVNHVYVLADPQIIVTDNVNVVFLVNITKNSAKNSCIFRVSQEKINGLSIQIDPIKNLYQQFTLRDIEQHFNMILQTVKINRLLQKSINRNIIKTQVGLLQVEVIYGSIRCSKCGVQIKKSNSIDMIQEKDEQYLYEEEKKVKNCYRQQHNSFHGLQLWGIIRGADSTGSCLVSFEHKELIQYLELEKYYNQIETFVRNYGKGLVLINSNKEKIKADQDQLSKIRFRIKKNYVQKLIVGYAKTQLDKTFRESLTQQQQLQYQASFQSARKYLQYKKIFPNGTIEKRTQQMLLLPCIKAIEVQELQW